MTNRRLLLLLLLLGAPIVAIAQDGASQPGKSSTEPTLTVAVVSPRCLFGDVDQNLKHFTELA